MGAWPFVFLICSHALAFCLGMWVGLNQRNGGPPGGEGEGEAMHGKIAAL